MPEGPEVRRYADALAAALEGEPIVEVAARTRGARAWLEEHGRLLAGRRVLRVRSHGKHLLGYVEGGVHFHSHLMMWGRWEVYDGPPPSPPDRRERARVVTTRSAAVLLSAPVFEIGTGDPYVADERLAALGPDALPYPEDGPFDGEEFLRRLLASTGRWQSVGAALLDQTVAAGIGNYLRAEILFHCRVDPWRRVEDLSPDDLECLAASVPEICRRAYEAGGATVEAGARERLRSDPALVYRPGREYGTRHYVFRRTNLPCLECGDTVRQLRQFMREGEEGDKTRIIYFCPTCQGTSVDLKPPRRRPRAGEVAAEREA